MMSKDRKETKRRRKEEEVDATGVTSMLLRVTGDGGKVSETRPKVAKVRQKVTRVEPPGDIKRLVAVFVHFLNEQGSVCR